MSMRLHLFTDKFPYGIGESYLNNEIPYLFKEFNDIYIYPYIDNGPLTATISDGYNVVELDRKKYYRLTLKDYLLAMKIHLTELYYINNKWFYLKRIRTYQAHIKEAFSIAFLIKESEYYHSEDLYYSYWMNIYALSLAILKSRGKIEKFVFRVNGFDVYDERHEGRYLPFRKFIYSKTEKVIAVSKAAKDYIKSKSVYSEKIDCSYFGTEDFGIKEFKLRDELVLFSCSSIIPLKRVNLIVEVLKLVKIPVKWVHHGSGKSQEELLENVKELPSNVEFIHSKHLPRYYDVLMLEKELSPDLFISFSETEGLPVTMMEAISMGIPVMATDVGGCSEIVNEETGILIPKDFEIEKVSKLITEFKNSNKDTKEYSQNVRNYWLNNFTAVKNYKTFALYLKQVFK